MRDWRLGNKFNLKHKELNEFYYLEPREVSYRDFMNRVLRQGYTKERALIKEPKYKPTPKSEIREDGRVCNRCGEFKLWEFYGKTKAGIHGRKTICKECTNKKHQEYRHSEAGRKKEQEYRKNKRKLNIGQQVLINNEVWEITDYKFKTGYTIKSLFSGDEMVFSTSDNWCVRNKFNIKSVRSYKVLTNNIEFVKEEEKEPEKPKFKLSMEDMFDDYYF